MVLFIHNAYRTRGGEERVVGDLARLVREELGEGVELLERGSAGLSRGRAARGLLRGGLDPEEVAGAVRRSGARVVHAHNLHPTLGWRALEAARGAGARVILHLHQYRLVCAVGVCFTDGEECTRCHGRNTLPGVLRGCRGGLAEAVAYGAGLALWQRRIVGAADAVVVPSEFARARLRELGAGLPEDRVHVLPPPVREAPPPTTDGAELKKESHPSPGRDPGPVPPGSRPYALVVSRLAPEKGVDVAIEACALAGVPLVIAGGGPEGEALRARGAGREVRFVGRVGDGELRALRAGAAIALVPSRSAETFGLAAAEAMAAGVPVAGSRAGALPELIEPAGLADAGDPRGLAGAMGRLLADPGAGARARERVRGLCAPERAAAGLARVYLGEHERP